MRKEKKKKTTNKIINRTIDLQLKINKAKRNGFVLGLFIGALIGVIATFISVA